MSEAKTDHKNDTDPSPADTQDKAVQPSEPYGHLLSEVVAKIKDQPFLFVIAIAALMIGAVVFGAQLGSADLRFVIIVIAVLAVFAILGYYLREGLNLSAKKRAAEAPQKQPVPGRQQKIEAAAGAQLDGALQEATGVESQVIVAKGEGTSVKDVIQSSTGEPPEEKE